MMSLFLHSPNIVNCHWTEHHSTAISHARSGNKSSGSTFYNNTCLLTMEPPRKKAKPSGRFLPEWKSQFNRVIVATKSKNDQYAHCTMCRRDIKVTASGVYDVNQHIISPLHKQNMEETQTQPTLSSFVKPQKSSTVLKSEVMFSNFIVQPAHRRRWSPVRFITEALPRQWSSKENLLQKNKGNPDNEEKSGTGSYWKSDRTL